MPTFEGKEFSTITDIMPAKAWSEEHFFSDWEKEMIQAETHFNKEELKMAKEVVLKVFYTTYLECRLLIEDEDELKIEEKQELLQKLNLAMTNLLEFGQRPIVCIVSSLKDRKRRSSNMKIELFNDVIDLLIQELQMSNEKFFEILHKVGEKKK